MNNALVNKVFIKEISPRDTMRDDKGDDEYFRIGRNAMLKCKNFLDGQSPARIIDFPSGYGRALRWFKHEWPEAELFAVETDGHALEFTTERFGATPIQAHPRLEMQIPGDADLIFTGSLLTHFDEWQWDRFLEMTINALKPGGVLVATIHGRVNALLLKDYPTIYGEIIDGRSLYAQYVKTGFAYQPYDKNYPEFGVSLSSPEWVFRKIQRLPFAKVIAFEEQGWGQDIIAFRKNEWSMI
ncbi:class I SAM-dependent methyltransferase [Methylobacterium sp. W2]|uniref:class I SAM-dependent methyltransferase n=1 Tax=Methylobacterium sp. W2 TaxID=2598107 RepID=UPI001D0CAB4B|nr:class I SAM-dependent methyltransferase [Methylobacterium sp. W2]MCC0804698.1 class I SAM-dependent methyltransferase [Methylobacterium sp. W2]